METAQCKKCLQKFKPKDIYTIQQFQYRKTPPYKWTLEFFASQGITEWDSFCESCLTEYGQISHDKYEKQET